MEVTDSASLPRKLDLVPDGRTLVVLYPNRLVRRDIDSGTDITIAGDLRGNESGFRVSLDGRRVSLHDGRSLNIWDTASGNLVRAWPSNDITYAWMMPDGRRILQRLHPVGDTLTLSHIDTGELAMTLSGRTRTERVRISRDGRWVTAWTSELANEQLSVTWDTATGQQVVDPGEISDSSRGVRITYDGFWAYGHGITSACAVLPGGRGLVGGFSDGRLCVWDGVHESEVRWLANHSAAVAAVAVPADGCGVVSAAEDGTIHIFRLDYGAVTKTFCAHARLIECVIRSDGKTVVALEAAGRVHVLPNFVNAPGGRYTVWVDDNNYPLDSAQGYKLGDFDDCRSATEACERLVDDLLLGAATGISAEELLTGFRAYGEDPWIRTDDKECKFSAWKYAERRCREIAGDLWNDKDAKYPVADKRQLETSLSSAEIADRVMRLEEPRTFGGAGEAGGVQFIIRMRDGTSLRLSRETNQGPVSATVVLPRHRMALTNSYRREMSDTVDAERRLDALAGLLTGDLWDAPGSAQEIAGRLIDQALLERSAETLSLSSIWLMEVPRDIARLYSLMELWLDGNRLTSLPREIGQLGHLTHLSVAANFLEKLPPEIGQLTSLEYLDLSANMLTEVPAEIGRLTNLRDLRLSKNRLEKLPKEIGKLSRLARLCIDRNRLTDLPAEVGELTNLSILWMHHNRLTRLPPEVGRLTKLKPSVMSRGRGGKALPVPTPPGLMVEGNPLVDPPAEIKGTAEIMAYLLAKTDRT